MKSRKENCSRRSISKVGVRPVFFIKAGFVTIRIRRQGTNTQNSSGLVTVPLMLEPSVSSSLQTRACSLRTSPRI